MALQVSPSPAHVYIYLLTMLSIFTTRGGSLDLRMSVVPVFATRSYNRYYIPIGETVRVTCTLTSSHYNVTDLIFEPSSNETATVNATSISLSLKVSVVLAPFQKCCIKQCPSNKVAATLYFGHPPSKVENFKCISVSLANLNCSWTVHPGHSKDVNWTMEYGVFNTNNVTNKTYCINIFCQLKGTRYADGTRYVCVVPPEQFLERANYSIRVSGRNDYGISTYTTSFHSDLSIATYPMLVNLTVSARGSEWLHVTWPAADTSNLPSNATYNVSLVYSNQTMLHFITNQTSYNITGLKPYTNYTVAVQTRPYSENYNITSVWSEAITINVRTDEASPSSPPVLTSAGFTWWARDSVPRLTVYWEAVPEASRNGIVTGYKLCLHVEDTVYRANVTDESKNSYTWKNILYTHSMYNVTVQAGTKAGYSEPNTVIIPPTEVTERHRVDYVTAERLSASLYNISWLTSQRNVDNVTVTWSVGSSPDNVEHFGWQLIPGNATYKLVNKTKLPQQLQQLQDDTALRFGAALSYRNWTSGIEWSQCVFGQSQATQAPEADFTTTEDDLVVTLLFSYCDSVLMKSRPLFYTVMYHRQLMEGRCDSSMCMHGETKTVRAEYDTSSIRVKTLQHSADYCVCMRIVYRNGTGPVSHPASVRLKDPPDVPSNTGIVVGLGVLSCIVGIFVCTVMLHVKKKKIRVKYPIDESLLNTLQQWDKKEDGPRNNIVAETDVEQICTGSENPAFNSEETRQSADVRGEESSERLSIAESRQVAGTSNENNSVEILLDNDNIVCSAYVSFTAESKLRISDSKGELIRHDIQSTRQAQQVITVSNSIDKDLSSNIVQSIQQIQPHGVNTASASTSTDADVSSTPSYVDISDISAGNAVPPGQQTQQHVTNRASGSASVNVDGSSADTTSRADETIPLDASGISTSSYSQFTQSETTSDTGRTADSAELRGQSHPWQVDLNHNVINAPYMPIASWLSQSPINMMSSLDTVQNYPQSVHLSKNESGYVNFHF